MTDWLGRFEAAKNNLTGWAGTGLGAITPDIAEPVLHPVGSFLGSTANAVHRTVATQYVAFGGSTEAARANGSVADDLLGWATPGRWRDAWNATNPDQPGGGIDPGEAIWAPIVDAAVYGSDTSESSLDVIEHTDPITGETTYKKRFFDETVLGGLLAGTTNLAVDWYTDPLFLGARAVRAGRDIARPSLVGEAAHPSRVDFKFTPGEQRKRFMAELSEGAAGGQNKSQVYMDRIGEISRTHSPGQATAIVAEIPAIAKSANPRGIAEALVGATNDLDRGLVMRVALGDLNARRILETRRPAIADALEQSEITLDVLNKAAKRVPRTDALDNVTWGWERATSEVAKEEAIHADLLANDHWLRGVLSEETGTTITGTLSEGFARASRGSIQRETAVGRKTLGFNRVDADFRTAEKAAWRRTASWSTTTPNGPYGPIMVKVARANAWLWSEEPIGVIATDGVKVAQADREILAQARKVGFEDSYARGFVADYYKARTPVERAAVVERMDNATWAKIQAEEGLTDEALDKVKALYSEGQESIILTTENGRGWYKNPDTGESILVPWLETHGANAKPMLDYQAVKEAVHDHKALLNSATKLDSMTKGVHATKAVLGALTDIWKVSVLMRGGYAQRNIAQNLLDGWIATSHIAGHPISGTRNVVVNAGRRQVNKRLETKRAILLGTEDAPGSLRSVAKERDTYVADRDKLIAEPAGTRLAPNSPEEITHPLKPRYYENAAETGSVVNRDLVAAALQYRTDLNLLGSRQRDRYLELHNQDMRGELIGDGDKELRALHSKASRKMLKQAQKKGYDVVYRDPIGGRLRVVGAENPERYHQILRDGVIQTKNGRFKDTATNKFVKKDDAYLKQPERLGLESIPDEVLFPHASGPNGLRPDAELYIVPKYARSVQEALHAGKRVDALVLEDAKIGKGQNPAIIEEKFHTEQQNLDIEEYDRLIAETEVSLAAMRDVLETLTPQHLQRLGEGLKEIRPGYGVAEAFGDTYGPIARTMAGVAGTVENLAFARHSVLRKRALGRHVAASGKFSYRTPSDPYYYHHLHQVLTHEYANDELGRLVLGGRASDEEILAHLRQQEDWLHRTGNYGKDDDELLAVIAEDRARIERSVPDAELREKALSGKVEVADVQNALGGRRDLVEISGEDLAIGPTGQNKLATVGQLLEDQVIAPAFHLLNTLPENNLVAWPFYNSVFLTHMGHLVDVNKELLDGMTDSARREALDKFRPAAHQQALKEVNRILYRADRRYGLAGKLSFVSPFLQVMMNRSYYYAHVFIERPDQFARILIGWDAIGSSDTTDGERVFTVHLPGFAKDVLGVPHDWELVADRHSLNLMFSGQPWYSPGFGPAVTAPVGWMVRNQPQAIPDFLKPAVDFVLPYGPRGSLAADLLPSTANTWMEKEDTLTWANNYAKIWAYMDFMNRTDPANNPAPTPEEVEKRTQALHLFKVLDRAALPIGLRAQSPLEPYMEEYRNFQQKYGYDSTDQQAAYQTYLASNPDTTFQSYQRMFGPDAQFFAKYPDYFDAIVYTLKTNPTGVDANASAQRRLDNNSNLASDLASLNPRLVGLMANSPGDQSHSQTFANYQLGRPVAPGSGVEIRSSVSPQEAVADQKIDRGWIAYNQARSQIDTVLEQRKLNGGSNNLQDSSNAKLKAQWDDYIIQLKAWAPEWAFDFSEHDDLYWYKNVEGIAALAVSGLDTTEEWAASAESWAASRQEIKNALLARKANGGSADLTAQSNTQLRNTWLTYVQDLKDSNPAWSDVYNQFLDGDMIREAALGIDVLKEAS